MHPYPSEHKRQQQKAPGSRLQRILLTLTLLTLSAIIVCILFIWQLWRSSNIPGQHPTSVPVVAHTPTPSPSPTLVPTPTPTGALAQRIDTYIDHLTQAQQIG